MRVVDYLAQYEEMRKRRIDNTSKMSEYLFTFCKEGQHERCSGRMEAGVKIATRWLLCPCDCHGKRKANPPKPGHKPQFKGQAKRKKKTVESVVDESTTSSSKPETCSSSGEPADGDPGDRVRCPGCQKKVRVGAQGQIRKHRGRKT